MKIKSFLVIVCVLFFSKSFALKYSITGLYHGSQPYSYVTLNFIPENGSKSNIIQHCPIKNGKFNFSGDVDLNNRSYLTAIIYLESEIKNEAQLNSDRDGFHNNWTSFILEPKINIIIKDEIRKAVLSGGKIPEEFNEFEKNRKPEAIDNFILSHPKSFVSLDYIYVLAKALKKFNNEEFNNRINKTRCSVRKRGHI